MGVIGFLLSLLGPKPPAYSNFGAGGFGVLFSYPRGAEATESVIALGMLLYNLIIYSLDMINCLNVITLYKYNAITSI